MTCSRATSHRDIKTLGKLKLLIFVALMGSLGNLLGLVSITIPSPFLNIELHFSQLTPLLVGIHFGPLWGAITGALSLIIATIKIGNPLIPLGNAILAGVAGIAAKKFRPLLAGLIGELAETPFIWFSILLWVGMIHKVPFEALIPLIMLINVKAFLEVTISSAIVEMLLKRSEIREYLDKIAK